VDPVATLLGDIQCLVSQTNELLCGGGVLRVEGNADAEVQGQLPRLGDLSHAVPDPTRDNQGILAGGDADEDKELIASPTKYEIRPARSPEGAFGHQLKDLITDLMTQRVIDLLEAVEITQNDGERSLASLGPGHLLVEAVSKGLPIEQTG